MYSLPFAPVMAAATENVESALYMTIQSHANDLEQARMQPPGTLLFSFRLYLPTDKGLLISVNGLCACEDCARD